MKVAFDTSVLVAALVDQHPDHTRALAWLEAAQSSRIEGVASWHAIAETWAVLTRIPLVPRLSPIQAEKVVLSIGNVLTLIHPTAPVYRATLHRVSQSNLRSGAIFDAIHMITAERARADRLLTFNLDDFIRLARPDSPDVMAPPNPPDLTG